jgi:ABC-2 type transport system permease protein
MPSPYSDFRRSELFKPAIIVPTVIMLVFSIFNLTAPADPARILSSFELGIVNKDIGPFPLVSTKAIKGISKSLPFRVTLLKDSETARDSLLKGKVSSVITFPENFSQLALSNKNLSIDILNSQHLTIAETQMASQLPSMMQLALSTFVSSLRASKLNNQASNAGMVVTTNVETMIKTKSLASLPAPFVMSFTTWMASMVGAILLYLGTRQMAFLNRAYVRTIVPIMTMGLASFALATVVTLTTLQWEVFLMTWLSVWLVSVCLTWLFIGIFEIIGLSALLIILPLVQYQSVLSGSVAPVSAAPDWLERIGTAVPFDAIGAAYRAIIFGSDASLPFIWLSSAALIGIVLSWGSAIFKGRMKRRW